MGKQLADRYSVLVTAPECGDVVNDGVIEPDLLLVVENHDRRGSADDLAKGCHVVDRAHCIDGSAVRAPGEPAEALLEHRRALSAHNDRGARVASSLDTALDYALNRAE